MRADIAKTINGKSRDEWERLILQWVHNERDRKILTRYLLDGVHYEPLAEEFDLSVQRVKAIVPAACEQLFKHIK